ncbi:MAG: L,D-transpeptidase [Muribaculaceae bacterium]|nr:L,D-transpeptidase [Muribaculaceae bacterium]
MPHSRISVVCSSLFAILSVFSFLSCSVKKESEQGNRQYEGFSENVEENNDTVIKEPEPVRRLHFNSSEEAISYMRESADWSHYEKGILPQMADDELNYATRLLNNTHDGFIVVDKARMKVIRFNKFGEEVASFGMACARNFGTKHEKPDNRTPEGFFSVRKVHDSTEWQFVDDNGVKSEKKGEFGPRFIRLNIPGWYSIGIHGTCAPWSIGGRRSHGCIRLTNENIMKLVEMVDSGMPVIVTPGRRDMAVNLEEDCEIPAISTIPGKPAPKLSEAARKQALEAREKKNEPTDTVMPNVQDTVANAREGKDVAPAKEKDVNKADSVAVNQHDEIEIERN